jgi:protein TonB
VFSAAPRALPGGEIHRRLAAAFLGSIALHAAAAAVLDVRGTGEQSKDPVGQANPLVLHAVLRLERAKPPQAPRAAEAEPTVLAQAPVAPQQAPAHPLATVPETHYYKSSELQVRPSITTNERPESPVSALGSGVTGTVILRLFVDADGHVERVQTVSSEPQGYFEEAAEKAFQAAAFTPGYRDGRPVPVQIVIEVLFEEQPLGAK